MTRSAFFRNLTGVLVGALAAMMLLRPAGKNEYRVTYRGTILAADEASAYRVGRAFGRALDRDLR